MWQCINNTPLCCVDCLFQTSSACTAHRQTKSFSGWVLSDNLPGCSLEKIIRHTELESVKSFYFIFSMHSALVQQSSGWISTPIKIPYFQEFISCLRKEREQGTTAWEWGSGVELFAQNFEKQPNQSEKCSLHKANGWAGGGPAAEAGHWGDLAAQFGVQPSAFDPRSPSSPGSAYMGRRRDTSCFRGLLGSRGTQMPGHLFAVELILRCNILYSNRFWKVWFSH